MADGGGVVMSELSAKAWVFNVQRFSIHDGPGIRTTVFMKGCNLRCFWCHNPESQRLGPELQFFPQKCIGCGKCFEVCPEGCHRRVDGVRVFDRARCRRCGRCAETCYAEALVLTGKERSAREVLDEVLLDRDFYGGEGGMTLSGGEPLLQPDFAEAILRGACEAGLHTAVETALCLPWETVERLLPWTKLWLCDLKVMEPETHKRAIGADNTLILENLRRLDAALAETEGALIVRFPLVPGINDTIANLDAVAAFLRPFRSLRELELLKFHKMAGSKYKSLDRAYDADALEPLSQEQQRVLEAYLRATGLPVKS